MTRGLVPPDTLTKDDIRTLGDVRRDIWTNAAVGGGYGAGTGLAIHTGASWARRYGMLNNVKLSRATLMVSVLLGGSIGSFFYAKKTGEGQVHKLHPIFQAGATPRDGESMDYQTAVAQAKRNDIQEGDLDMNKLEQMRMVRRRTLMNNLKQGHGLSDSHGGQWTQGDQRQKTPQP